MAVLKVLVIDDEPSIRLGVSRIMRNLIMDLLDLTKIRLERKDEKVQEVDLSAVASGAIVTVQPYAIQMEVVVNLEVRSETIIIADPGDMDIVFNNLISNAVKYNKFGGKVDITLDSTGTEAILVVSDTGIGISKENSENLFTEFVRIRNEKTGNISGSGLGLSIVRKVIELYHGTIKVESIPDTGTTFTVRLPKKQITIT